MISLIGSLADNKSALGRRYGEWAVSAPTIESAVAAAAMAQDELGHARRPTRCWPSSASARDDAGLDTGHPMLVISQELPDWASVIAANLVVDGILTTFVAVAPGTARSSRSRSGRRRSSRRRARTGCTLRPGRGESSLRTGTIWSCCGVGSTRCGQHAARWPGPDLDARYREAIAAGMVSEGPLAIRDRVRRLALPAGRRPVARGATDWSDWDEQYRDGLPVLRLRGRRVGVARGGRSSRASALPGCNTYFEAIRAAFDGGESGPTSATLVTIAAGFPQGIRLDRRAHRKRTGAIPDGRPAPQTIGRRAGRSLAAADDPGEYVLPRGEAVWQETSSARSSSSATRSRRRGRRWRGASATAGSRVPATVVVPGCP